MCIILGWRISFETFSFSTPLCCQERAVNFSYIVVNSEGVLSHTHLASRFRSPSCKDTSSPSSPLSERKTIIFLSSSSMKDSDRCMADVYEEHAPRNITIEDWAARFIRDVFTKRSFSGVFRSNPLESPPDGKKITAVVYQRSSPVIEFGRNCRCFPSRNEKISFEHDNVRPHDSCTSMSQLSMSGQVVLLHYTYSPGFALIEYSLFRELRRDLGRTRLQDACYVRGRPPAVLRIAPRRLVQARHPQATQTFARSH